MNSGPNAKCSCFGCATHIEFPLELAGQEIDCPHCGARTRLDLSTNESPTQPPADVAAGPTFESPGAAIDTILAGFAGPVPTTTVPRAYRVGLALVAVVMLLMPVLYLAIVAGVAWFLVLFVTGPVPRLARTGTGLPFTSLILILAIVFSGVVTLLFLIKPIFARRAPQAQPLALNPEVEPALFAFIARVCDTVGAPRPARIDLDCQLNASAGFRQGVLNLQGGELVLTIGLPLVAGLNLRQFAGILAHEFGHFTQGTGMRLFFTIRHINAWFARLVYERDAFDVALEEWAAEAEHLGSAFVLHTARFGVAVSRLLLRVPMYLGLAVSSFLSRQMEYDADQYEIHLAGSDTFASTAQRLVLLDRARQRAYEVLRTLWQRDHRLPDHFPAFLLHQETRLDSYVRARTENAMRSGRTGLLDTHPSFADRLARARTANAPGVFHDTGPATTLFADFDAVARQVTFLHYTEDLRLPAVPAILVPLATLVR
jgi:Zn-dependent protease with chaperone function